MPFYMPIQSEFPHGSTMWGGLPVGKGMRSCCESASRYVREKDNPTGRVLVFYESALSATLTASAHSIRFLNRSQPYS